MKIRKEAPKDGKLDPASQMLDWTGKSYSSFRNLVTIQDHDPVWVMVLKILAGIFGILIMIALSPFLLIGLIIAFAAVL